MGLGVCCALVFGLLSGSIAQEHWAQKLDPGFGSDGGEPEPMAISKPLGEVTGVAFDKEGNLLVFHRGDRIWDKDSFTASFTLNSDFGPIQNSTIYTVDRTSGLVVSEHGENQFYMPHGMATDKEGNIYLTDVGLHQVIRLDPNFTVTLTLGEKLVPGDDDSHFCQPTDIAIASNGDFFVADGYCNSRIMKFDKTGKLIEKFGNPNSFFPPESGEFLVPHSLALIEDLNLLCVADRENERIQCFAAGLEGKKGIPTGTLITKAEDIGRVFGIREKNHYLIGITGTDSDEIESQMFVIDINSGKATSFAQGLDGHSLTVDDNGDTYVATMNPNQIIHLHLS